MGKKRRMKTNLKFRRKHDTHPRMKALYSAKAPPSPPSVVAEPAQVEATLNTVLEEETVEEVPEVVAIQEPVQKTAKKAIKRTRSKKRKASTTKRSS